MLQNKKYVTSTFYFSLKSASVFTSAQIYKVKSVFNDCRF